MSVVDQEVVLVIYSTQVDEVQLALEQLTDAKEAALKEACS